MAELQVVYSSKQIDVVMDAAKTLIPVTTAYIAFVAGTAKYIFELDRPAILGRLRILVVIFALSLLSLAAWIFAIGAVADAARAFQLASAPSSQTGVVSAKEAAQTNVYGVSIAALNLRYFLAVKAQQVAVISFFLSLVAYCTLVLRTFAEPGIRNPREKAQDEPVTAERTA